MNQYDQKWESAGLSNDFIFGKVMQNENICKELLQRIFPEMHIDHIKYIETQKTIKTNIDSHGVRLDVYVKDEHNSIYNIEMQTVNTKEIPKRSRYYQSKIDNDELDSGKKYSELPSSYIIFICMTDLFGKGRYKYTFENRCCEDVNIILGDETKKIFFNANGTENDINEDMKIFLEYLNGKISDDPFIKKLDETVNKTKMNKEWRNEFMTLEMKYTDGCIEGEEKGMAKMLIRMSNEMNWSKEKTLKKLQKELNISLEKAQEYFRLYNKKTA